MPATFFVVNGLDGSNASTRGRALCKGLFSHLSETLILLKRFGGRGPRCRLRRVNLPPLAHAYAVQNYHRAVLQPPVAPSSVPEPGREREALHVGFCELPSRAEAAPRDAEAAAGTAAMD